MMITFTLELPKLTDEQQIQLEEVLLKVPRVDAFALDDGSGHFSITTEEENSVLRDAVAALYGWASEYAGMVMQMTVVCGEKRAMLGKHSPNDIIHFLTTC